MKTALIRKCDVCNTVTAIDMDNTLTNKKEMQMIGQTVYEISEMDAMKEWKNASPCKCNKKE